MTSPPNPERTPPKRRRSWLPKLVFTAVVLYLVASSVDGARVVRELSGASVPLVGVATLATVLLNALRPLRWLWLLQGEGASLGYREALSSHLFAVGARLVLPSHVGELGKALAVEIDPARAAGFAVVDLTLDVWTTLVVAALGATLLVGPLPLAAVGLLTGLALPLGPAIGRWLGRRPCGALRGRLHDAWEAGRTVSRAALGKGLALSFFLQGVRIFQLAVLLLALGAVVTPRAIACLPFIQLADAFSFTLGRVGVREWLGAQVLPSFGLTPELAVSAIFLQTIISNILPGLVGAAVVYRTRRGAWAQLRALRGPTS